VQRNRIITALAATLALAACTPDAAERVTGPGRSSYDHQPKGHPGVPASAGSPASEAANDRASCAAGPDRARCGGSTRW
jgi:hypothetical protein